MKGEGKYSVSFRRGKRNRDNNSTRPQSGEEWRVKDDDLVKEKDHFLIISPKGKNIGKRKLPHLRVRNRECGTFFDAYIRRKLLEAKSAGARIDFALSITNCHDEKKESG